MFGGSDVLDVIELVETVVGVSVLVPQRVPVSRGVEPRDLAFVEEGVSRVSLAMSWISTTWPELYAISVRSPSPFVIAVSSPERLYS